MGVDPWVDRGTNSPYFLSGGDAVFCPPTFSGVDIFVLMHSIHLMIGAIFVKFSQLILMKIIKTVATRCQFLRLKCTKFNVGWGSAPDPAGRAYSAPETPS